MKLETIKKKIVINSVTLLILLAIMACGVFFYIKFNNESSIKISKIYNQKNLYQQEIYKLQNQAAEYLKYTEIWNDLDIKKKQFEEIKSDKINKLIEKISKKYSIKDAKITLSVPKKVSNPIFDNLTTISLMSTIIDISYFSLTDINSINFINNFISNLSGQKIISSLSIKKEKNYTVQDFGNISAGRSSGNIKTNIRIYWYPYEEKK
jgi:hypothetical protein